MINKIYKRFKKSIITEFLYRFLLWSLIGYLIALLASKASGNEGIVFSQLINKSTEFPDTMGVFGVMLACISLFFKDLLGSNKLSNFIFKEVSTLLGKISSDLVLVAFGAISFLLGSIFYYFIENKYTFEQLKSIILISPFIVLLLISIAFFSFIVRLKDDSLFWEKRKKIPSGIRFPIYIMAPSLIAYLLWFK